MTKIRSKILASKIRSKTMTKIQWNKEENVKQPSNLIRRLVWQENTLKQRYSKLTTVAWFYNIKKPSKSTDTQYMMLWIVTDHDCYCSQSVTCWVQTFKYLYRFKPAVLNLFVTADPLYISFFRGRIFIMEIAHSLNWTIPLSKEWSTRS